MDEPMRKSGQWPNVAIPAGSDPHEVMDSYRDNKEQDTREKLEADVASILRNAARNTTANTSVGDMLRYTVPGSGAAPWQTAEDACEALASIAEREISELTAELYRERKSREHAYNKLNKMYAFDGKRVKRINELTAEREQLQKVVRIQAESFRKLEQELKEAKDGVRGSHADDKPGDEKAEG